MKSTLILTVTVAVISSMVTYRIVSNQSGPKDIYRENEGEKSSIVPRETNQKSGAFRSEGPRPLQDATTLSLGSTSQPSHAKATSTPPPLPPELLHLQDSPDFIAQEKERKEEREKLRRELIQTMRDNGLPEEHIRQMEKMFMDLSPLPPESAEDVSEKTPSEIANDLVKSTVESNLPAEHQQRIREAAEQMARFQEERKAKEGDGLNLPPLPSPP